MTPLTLASFFDVFENPAARHAFFVHLPVVMGTLVIVPCVLWVATRFKNKTLGWLTLSMMLLTVIGSGLAAGAGEDAGDRYAERPGLSAEAQAVLEQHESLGENDYIWPLIASVILGATLYPFKTKVRYTLGVLSIVACLAIAAWITVTAHAGGRLVHDLSLQSDAVTVE